MKIGQFCGPTAAPAAECPIEFSGLFGTICAWKQLPPGPGALPPRMNDNTGSLPSMTQETRVVGRRRILLIAAGAASVYAGLSVGAGGIPAAAAKLPSGSAAFNI